MSEDSQNLNHRSTAAKNAAQKLSVETRQDIVTWFLRSGLGPMYLRHRPERNLTPEELGALMAIKFDHEKDMMHHDLGVQIDEWRERGGFSE